MINAHGLWWHSRYSYLNSNFEKQFFYLSAYTKYIDKNKLANGFFKLNYKFFYVLYKMFKIKLMIRQ